MMGSWGNVLKQYITVGQDSALQNKCVLAKQLTNCARSIIGGGRGHFSHQLWYTVLVTPF